MKRFIIERIVNEYDTWDQAMEKYHHKNGLWIPSDDDWGWIAAKQVLSHPDFQFAGYRSTGGSFYNRGTFAYFWSSSESGSHLWLRNLDSCSSTIYMNIDENDFGFSIALIREE